MTAKEFLKQYEYANRRVERLREEYEKERIMIDSVKSTLDTDGLPHGNGIKKTVEDRAIRLADKAAALKKAELEAAELRHEVFRTIYGIDGVVGDVMIERFIKLKTWDEVCKTIGYTWPTVHKHYRKGLDVVEKKIQEVTSESVI